MGQAGLDRGLAGGILPGAGGQHLTEDHLVDGARCDTGLLEHLADQRGAQIRSGN
ncbi:hypothetical protein D3C72_2062430 [compost metagenome]